MIKEYVSILFSLVFLVGISPLYAGEQNQSNTSTEDNDDESDDSSAEAAETSDDEGSDDSEDASTPQTQQAQSIVEAATSAPNQTNEEGSAPTSNAQNILPYDSSQPAGIRPIEIPQDTLITGKINAVSGWNIHQYGSVHGLHAVLWPVNTSWEMTASAIFVFVNDRTQTVQHIDGANVFAEKCPSMSIIKLPDLYHKGQSSLFRFFSGANRQYNTLRHIDGGKYSVIILYTGPSKQDVQTAISELAAQYKNALETSAGSVSSTKPSITTMQNAQ